MTTKEKLVEMVYQRGVFRNDAETIITEAIPKINDLEPSYHFTWDAPAEGYPDEVYQVLWVIVKEVALEWIGKNKPQAWYRQQFV